MDKFHSVLIVLPALALQGGQYLWGIFLRIPARNQGRSLRRVLRMILNGFHEGIFILYIQDLEPLNLKYTSV